MSHMSFWAEPPITTRVDFPRSTNSEHFLHQLEDIEEPLTTARGFLQPQAKEKSPLLFRVLQRKEASNLTGIELTECLPLLAAAAQECLGREMYRR